MGQGGHGFLLSEEKKKNKVFLIQTCKKNYITIDKLPVTICSLVGLISNNKGLKKTEANTKPDCHISI